MTPNRNAFILALCACEQWAGLAPLSDLTMQDAVDLEAAAATIRGRMMEDLERLAAKKQKERS